MTEYLVGALAGLIDLIPWLQLCLLPFPLTTEVLGVRAATAVITVHTQRF